MNLTAKNLRALHDKCMSDDWLLYGTECLFIAHKKIGYKFYWAAWDRDHAFKNQKEFYNKGLAPRVYKRFSFLKEPYIDSDRIYGYTTQVATIKGPNKSSDVYSFLRSSDCPESYDCHDDNFGYIGNKLVIIDFGPSSLS